MPFVWSIGTIIGPAIGGTFANPSKSFPSLFAQNGLFGTFPYLLPNLICASMLLISIVAGYFLLEETHPGMQPWNIGTKCAPPTTVETPLIPSCATENTPNILSGEAYGTFNAVDLTESERWLVQS